MKLSYDGLWEMLFNLNVTKMEFARNVGISNATLAKLGKNEPVSLTILMKICECYNCEIGNIVKFKPVTKKIYPDISTMNVGTILICTSYPLGATIRSKYLYYKTKILRKHPSVVLQKYLRDDYAPQLLVAPLSYDLCPDTIFDIPFKNLELDEGIIKSGYIQIGKMGYILQNDFEKVIGKMDNNYLNNALELLKRLESIVEIKK